MQIGAFVVELEGASLGEPIRHCPNLQASLVQVIELCGRFAKEAGCPGLVAGQCGQGGADTQGQRGTVGGPLGFHQAEVSLCDLDESYGIPSCPGSSHAGSGTQVVHENTNNLYDQQVRAF